MLKINIYADDDRINRSNAQNIRSQKCTLHRVMEINYLEK